LDTEEVTVLERHRDGLPELVEDTVELKQREGEPDPVRDTLAVLDTEGEEELERHRDGLPELVGDVEEVKHREGLPELVGECELERHNVEVGLPEREPLGDFEGLALAELDRHSEGLPELVLEIVELKHREGLPELVGECELDRHSVEVGLPEREPLGDFEGVALAELDRHSEGLPELVLEIVELKHREGLPELVGECELERHNVEVGLPEREPLGDFEGLALAELDRHSEGLPELVLEIVELKHKEGLPELVGECELDRHSVEVGLPEREPLGDFEGLALAELDRHSEGLPELVLEIVELKHREGLPELVGECELERHSVEVGLSEREPLGDFEGLVLELEERQRVGVGDSEEDVEGDPDTVEHTEGVELGDEERHNVVDCDIVPDTVSDCKEEALTLELRHFEGEKVCVAECDGE
jgi:hypothetical protein